jgi:AraC-like DNA-binding protein
MNAVSTLHAVGLVLCLFSCGILNAKVRARRVTYFSWYFGLEAACCLLETLLAIDAAPFKALWLSLLMMSSLLLAPALWLALQEATGERPALASISVRQRLLIASGALLTLPLIATTHDGSGFADPDRIGSTFLESIIHETMVGCLALFAIQVPIYLLRCRALLTRSDSSTSQRWLQIPVAIVFTTWVLGMVRTVAGVRSVGSDELFTVLAGIDVGVTIACIYLILKTLAGTPASQESVQRASAEATAPATAPKYARSQLDPNVRARILRKLDSAFRIEQLHRDSGLTLAVLSEALKEREHYVSQVINQDLDTTFYELLNRHRVEQACQLLRHSPELGVLEIALAVGFNTKSTFNSAFRRLTGMTPREYRTAASEPMVPSH